MTRVRLRRYGCILIPALVIVSLLVPLIVNQVNYTRERNGMLELGRSVIGLSPEQATKELRRRAPRLRVFRTDNKIELQSRNWYTFVGTLALPAVELVIRENKVESAALLERGTAL